MRNESDSLCPFCRTLIPAGAIICTGCGARLHVTSPNALVSLVVGVVPVGLAILLFLLLVENRKHFDVMTLGLPFMALIFSYRLLRKRLYKKLVWVR